jgi:hypothetical protein
MSDNQATATDLAELERATIERAVQAVLSLQSDPNITPTVYGWLATAVNRIRALTSPAEREG